ncbi:MAG: SLC13 family permease [Planctomycetales bacterium]|nr:SLC13 family permease [Planctomycetales bacterium]
MSTEAWITSGTVLVMLLALLRGLAPPDLLFLSATLLFAAIGVITVDEAFSGFSNPGMITVAFLFVVAAALRETGVLDAIGSRVLGGARTERDMVARLAVVVTPLSAFLNNTPIVAMFIPVLLSWSRRTRIAPSRVLMPLSILTILGGTCTLIGTSTNLVVDGLLLKNGLPGMSLFELAPVGVPYAVVGIIYLLTVGRRWLPDRQELLEQLGQSRREFLVEMSVEEHCRLVGQTVEAAGLRHLPGLFLVEIDRGDKLISPVAPDELIRQRDRLLFTGVVSSIVELEKTTGLVPAADPSYEASPAEQRRRRLCEAVVSANSPLIGKTIRAADFRASYGAAVLAIHRGGTRINQKLGDVALRPGDTLLLQTQPHFLRAYRNDPAFYLISDVAEWRPVRRDRAWIAVLGFAALLTVITFEVLPTHLAAGLAAAAMVLTGAISTSDARKSVEWQVLITIAASFGVGAALQNSGAAAAISGAIFSGISGWGPIAALAAVYMVGSLVTEVITNNAAAVLLFPFCLETAKLYDVSPRPFILALALAASASFMTPIGYQTNLMIYGPGGYRFSDFVRVGAPLNFVLWIVAVALIPVFWPF